MNVSIGCLYQCYIMTLWIKTISLDIVGILDTMFRVTKCILCLDGYHCFAFKAILYFLTFRLRKVILKAMLLGANSSCACSQTNNAKNHWSEHTNKLDPIDLDTKTSNYEAQLLWHHHHIYNQTLATIKHKQYLDFSFGLHN